MNDVTRVTKSRGDYWRTGRAPYDNYQTPVGSIKPLLTHVDLSGVKSFLEPCRGSGNIYNLIDVKRKDYCEIREGKDYLDTKFRKRFDLIITNPPFTVWRPFLEKSLAEADTVIYLLRLNVLGSGKKTRRADFWNKHRPTHIFPLESRPSFTGGGTDSTDYCWIAFDRGNFVNAPHWLTVL